MADAAQATTKADTASAPALCLTTAQDAQASQGGSAGARPEVRGSPSLSLTSVGKALIAGGVAGGV